MKGFVQDIEDLAVKNHEFRRVLYTAKHCQLVMMALKPKEESSLNTASARPSCWLPAGQRVERENREVSLRGGAVYEERSGFVD